jgi:predicted secreted protein
VVRGGGGGGARPPPPSGFINRIDILSNKFERYIDKKDLICLGVDNGTKCDVYQNTFNNLIFNHDFPKNIPLDDTYQSVAQKYDRRIGRLLNFIEKKQKILAVYIELPNNIDIVSDMVLIEAQKKLNGKFHKPIDILYISCSQKRYEKQLNNHITKIAFDYKDNNIESELTNIDDEKLAGIFEGFKLNRSIKQKILFSLKKKFWRFIPVAEIRRKFRAME